MELSGHELRLDYAAFDAWEQDERENEYSTDNDECQEGEVDAE